MILVTGGAGFIGSDLVLNFWPGKNQSYSSETSAQNLRGIASTYTSFWEIPTPLNRSSSQYSCGFPEYCRAD
jgi:hypothetical protein